jgi:hypothetical protein
MNHRAAQKFALLVSFILSLACFASAQDKNAAATDENIDLNITEERLTETNYERSTQISAANSANSVSVRVGASVRAETITVTLRGITANGRFRASLEKITRLLEQRIQD